MEHEDLEWGLTADITELPILEYQELFPLGDLLQALDCSLAKVVNDIRMRFQHADGITNLLCQAEQGRC